MLEQGQKDSDFASGMQAGWFALAFVAGSVNVGGFLACQRFVTHVTGFATLFGVEVVNAQWTQALSILTVPFFFVLGAMASSFLIDVQIARGTLPRYKIVLVLEASLLLLAGVLGSADYFGMFGSDYEFRADYVLLAMLCLASGLQNAAISTVSGTAVRTTHLTGLTTDLGTGFVRLLWGRLAQQHRRREWEKMRMRLGTIVSFGLGGVVGAVVFAHWQYLGFILPAVICALLAALSDKRAPYHLHRLLVMLCGMLLLAATPAPTAATPVASAPTVPSPAAVTSYRGPLGLKWGQLAPDARCRLEKRFTFISEVGPTVNNYNTIDQHYRGNFAGMPVDDMLLKFHRGEFFYLAVTLATSQSSTLTKVYADAVSKMVESYGPPNKENRPPRLVSANGIPDHTPVLDQGATVLPLLWNEQTGADANKLAQLHDMHIRSGLWQPFAGWQFANNVTIQIFIVMEKSPQAGAAEVIKPIWIIAKEDRLKRWQKDAGNRGLYHFPIEEWPPRDF